MDNPQYLELAQPMTLANYVKLYTNTKHLHASRYNAAVKELYDRLLQSLVSALSIGKATVSVPQQHTGIFVDQQHMHHNDRRWVDGKVTDRQWLMQIAADVEKMFKDEVKADVS